MMAAQEIVEYLRRIEQLKMEQGDVGAPVEIFRLSGVVRGMLITAGDGIWAELEAYGVVKQVLVEQLKETWKKLEEMRIAELTSGSGAKDQVGAEFPKYLELPGPVVRKMILSYLTDPLDELSMAKAIPSEVQYLSGPLNLIQLKAVFPLLMKQELLEPVDVMNLCAAHPYICGFVRKYYETVLWKDLDYLKPFSKDLEFWEVLDLDQVLSALDTTPDLVVMPPVLLVRFNQGTWNNLRICGSQVFHCGIQLEWDWEAEQKVQLIKRCLELLPNLRTLTISNGDAIVEERTIPGPRNPDFPELPYLRNLVVEDVNCALNLMLLAKYGEQLELLYLAAFGMFSVFGASNNMEILPNFVYGVTQCQLKVLNLRVHTLGFDSDNFQRLLSFLSDNWGNTLESLAIGTLPLESNPAGFAWIGNLGFPKLKRVALKHCFTVLKSWEFLLCCPALKELEYYEYDRNLEEQSEHGSGQGMALAELKPMIQLYNDRERMLNSNIWKLFPQLELLRFYDWEQIAPGFWRFMKMDVITRKECVAHQLQ